MPSPGLDQLRQLQDQLNGLIEAYSQHEDKGPLFALNDIGEPVSLEPQDSELAKISSTLTQMQAVVLGDKLPFQRAIEFHVISCLNVAVDAHAEESLREAWDRGVRSLHVEELAKPTRIDSEKLARCLRLLASYHIFAETAPNVFSRNRCSASLDSGVSLEALAADPLAKYASERGGVGSIIGHFAQEGLRSASYMSESLLSPTGVRDYGFSRAFDGKKIWEYFADEGNEAKRKRFHCGTGAMFKYLDREESVLLGFPWHSLPEGSTVCDVAGRTGNISLDIAKAVPHLKFIVQDQESIIDSLATQFWESAERQPYKDRIQLVAHDFFDPQPVKGAAVYLIRMALHGFNDEQVVQVLTQIAEAADPSSRLIIIESAYESLAEPGAYPPLDTTPYLLDLQMLTVINVRERLEARYVSIAKEAGWNHAKTWKTGGRRDDDDDSSRESQRDGVFRHYEFALSTKVD